MYNALRRFFRRVGRKLMRTNKFFNLLINNKWYISELRYHFGERVAFYFAFCNFYTKFLVPIVALGFVVTFAFRWTSWHLYSIALSIFGWGVARSPQPFKNF